MKTTHRLGMKLAVLLAMGVGAIQVGAMNGTMAGAMAGAQVVVSSSGASMTTTVTEMIGPGVSGGTKPMEIGTGVVMGRVVEADGTSPVAGTIVTLSLPGFAPQRVLTDGQGRFAYRGLPKGSFSLTASRPGFVDGAHGRLRPGGTPMAVEITDTLRTSTADIMVWRHAAIAGTVLDENNEPLVGAPVRALRRDYTGGRRRLTDSGFDTTDDRGQFRLGSLEPGEYVVVLPFTQRPSLDSMMRGMREAERSMSSGASGTFSVAAVRVEGQPAAAGVALAALARPLVFDGRKATVTPRAISGYFSATNPSATTHPAYQTHRSIAASTTASARRAVSPSDATTSSTNCARRPSITSATR